MSRAARICAVAAAALAGAAPAHAAPRVEQLVAFRDGSARQSGVVAAAATARVGSSHCAVGAGTPLAALIRSKPGPIGLKDFGACSKRAADAGGLYVASIRADRARGVDGWVYKVGTKAATAGAGDPSGPFGNGRLKSGARVTWFYCHMNERTHSCQRTLAVAPSARGGGALRVTVRGYDDRGRAKPAAGATVHAGSATATTDSSGVATFSALPTGRVLVHAEAKGAVRSFEETVTVR